MVCWGGGITVKDTNRLNKLMKAAGSITGSKLVTLEVMVKDRILAKLLAIMNNTSYPPYDMFDKLKSTCSNRFQPGV